MKRLVVLGVTAAAIAATATCTPYIPKYTFKYAEFRAKLDNGLRMVIVPDKTTSLVEVDVRYEVGSNEDPPGKAGLAHLVEHMMFQHHPLGPDQPATFQLLDQMGVVGFNAYTTYDQTHYYLVAPKENLEQLLRIEAFRMNAGCQTIPQEQFVRERDVVRNEIRQRGGTPEGLMPQMVSEDVYPAGHPYSHVTGGDDKQIASIQLQDVCDFMKKYYVPERAIVIVNGNVDQTQTGGLIKQTFGGIADRAPAPRMAVKPIELRHKKVVHKLDVEHPYVWVTWKLPPRNSKDWAKVNALFALVGKLSVEANDWDFATSVNVTEMGGQLAPTLSVILELPADGDVDKALSYVWSAARTAGWGLKDMDFDTETKNFLRMSFVEGIEGLAAKAALVADEMQFTDGAVDFAGSGKRDVYGLHEFFEIDKMTADGYGEFVKKTLDKDKAVVDVFLPSKQGAHGDVRANFTYTAKTDQDKPPALVDPKEALHPLPAPKSNSILDQAEHYTLSNGMRVVLLATDGLLPIVQAEVVFNAGAAQESPSRAGIASAATRFLRPPLDANFERYADFGAFADDDTTTFVSRGLNINTNVVIKGLERLTKIGEYDQEAFENWQKRIEDQYKSARFRRELAFEQEVYAGVYGPDHPYTTNGQPTPASAGNIGYDAAMDWKDKHYTAKNATLIVVGNFDVAQVKGLIQDNFGDWDGGRKDTPVGKSQLQRTGPEFVGVVGEKRPQVKVVIAYPAPAGMDSQHAARLILAEMLNQKMSEIRTELGSTYGIYGHLTSNLGPNAYLIDVPGQGYASVDAVLAGASLKAMRDKIDGLRKGEDFDRVFALARRKVLKGLLAQSTTTFSLASRLSRIAQFGLDPAYYDNLARYVAAASPAQVRALMATELDPKSEVVVLMNDRATLEKTFTDAGITDVRYVEPK